MTTHHQHLFKFERHKLRPTQLTLGFAEVRAKRSLWTNMANGQRQDFLKGHWFAAVLGPGNHHSTVNHHHLGQALQPESLATGFVVLLKDLSALAKDEFWTRIDHHQWVHPYDAKGKRQDAATLPKPLAKPTDDPYRSLAGEVRHTGGFAKDVTRFSEFLWADFFRRCITLVQRKRDPSGCLERAGVLCHSPQAAHLPGWSGRATTVAS